MVGARFHEPLIIGVGQENIFLSSDVLGFIEYTDNAIYMKSGNFVILENKEFEILDFNGEKVKHEITKVSKEFGDAYKGDYAHFTLKEIYEQPDLISKAGDKTIEGLEEAVDCIRNAKNKKIQNKIFSTFNMANIKTFFNLYLLDHRPDHKELVWGPISLYR